MTSDDERCTRIVNGRYSLSGGHTWYLTGRAGEKDREVRCHFCGEEPRRGLRARMMEEMLRFEREQLDQRRRMAELRKVMKGPA